jgi:hypothetical protein
MKMRGFALGSLACGKAGEDANGEVQDSVFLEDGQIVFQGNGHLVQYRLLKKVLSADSRR